MIYYIITDSNGAILGTGTAVSEADAIESGSDFGEVLCGDRFENVDPEKHYLKQGQLTEYPPRPSLHHEFNFDAESWDIFDLEAAQKEALAQVDLVAGVKRQKFITVSPGQDMTYARKLERAKEYANTANPVDTDFPFLKMEADATGLTVYELTQVVLNMDAFWEAAGSQIEAARRRAAETIKSASTLTEITEAQAFMTSELEAI